MLLAICLLKEKCNHKKLKSEDIQTKVNPLSNEMLNLASYYLLNAKTQKKKQKNSLLIHCGKKKNISFGTTGLFGVKHQ